ncbi:SseB family protein [uncultured Nocardioides sp.]|uniref:SseB family protein n=1 Tax=uncultured Nocardioides sp. TaxID=198441 RepID=UPI0026190563|nr:SseB family protein [uncultured Nocardioides sp.]
MSAPDNARRLLGSEFPDDEGGDDPRLRSALTAYAAADDPQERRALLPACLEALQGARLLVPVVAVLGEVEVGDDGLARDKSSDMAAVLLTGRDGRTALLSFTHTASMQAWDPEARPVPVRAQLAAQAAMQEGAAALLVDVAGPARLVVEGVDLEGLARGWRLARVGDQVAWVRDGSRRAPG